MSNKTIDKLLSFSIFFLALWFFGNLYEELVITPNQISNSYEKLQHWQHFFTETNPMYFYVPFTQLAIIIVCILYFKTTDIHQKQLLKKASIYGVLGILITVIIVTQINLKLYFGDPDKFKNQLKALSISWLVGNAIRLYLVWNSLRYVLKTYLYRKVINANLSHERN